MIRRFCRPISILRIFQPITNGLIRIVILDQQSHILIQPLTASSARDRNQESSRGRPNVDSDVHHEGHELCESELLNRPM